MEELMDGQPDDECNALLAIFKDAHMIATGASFSKGKQHILAAVRIEERRIALLEKMQRFRDQGEAMCLVAQMLFGFAQSPEAEAALGRKPEAEAARQVPSLTHKSHSLPSSLGTALLFGLLPELSLGRKRLLCSQMITWSGSNSFSRCFSGTTSAMGV